MSSTLLIMHHARSALADVDHYYYYYYYYKYLYRIPVVVSV